MMIAAVAGVPSDFAELKVRAVEVERHRYIPSHFELAMEGLRVFTRLATLWEQLEEPHRDLLRHLASALSEEAETSWFERTKIAVRVMFYISRHGVEQTYRQAHEFMAACAKFRSLVLGFDERNNETLQERLSEAITSSLSAPSRTPLSRGEVDGWIKRLPS